MDNNMQSNQVRHPMVKHQLEYNAKNWIFSVIGENHVTSAVLFNYYNATYSIQCLGRRNKSADVTSRVPLDETDSEQLPDRCWQAT
jgi:hypothetical protein